MTFEENPEESLKQNIESISPLVTFFSLSNQEQTSLIPALEISKYDFPDGDLLTNNPLEILINGYQAFLNSICIQLIILEDEEEFKNNELVSLVEKLLKITSQIANKDFNVIGNPTLIESSEWEILTQFSSALKQKLEVQTIITPKIVQNSIEYWLHP